MSYIGHLPEIGTSILGRAVTATLYVSPNGSGTNGKTWASAYTTIQAALDAASTDGNACTLIAISPHATFYDIDTTGDPTWTGNYILAGASRNWAKIKNTHASATSIVKFTGKVMLSKLNFNLSSGSANGVILTHGGFRVFDTMFVGEDLTGAATALHIDGAPVKHGRIYDSDFVGHATHMTGILLDNATRNELQRLHIHDCLTGVQIIHADSDENFFRDVHIGDCALGLDLDAGNAQQFDHITFHDNTVNVDDEVGDHTWQSIYGAFEVVIEPNNLTGVTVNTHANGDTWGADTEIRAAATSTVPFRIVAVHMEPSVSEWFRLRFSADSDVTHYSNVLFDGTKREGVAAPCGTEFIFNKGTRISASAQSESGGDNVKVWLEIQEI